MNELPITIVYREGPLNIVADTLSRRPQREQLFLSDEDAALCTKFLKRVAPQFTLKQCVDAAVSAMQKGCTVAHIICEHCHSAHLDEGDFTTRKHSIHVCNTCGKKWQHAGQQVQGNPLAAFQLQLVGNRLLLGQRQPAVGHAMHGVLPVYRDQCTLPSSTCSSQLHAVENLQPGKPCSLGVPTYPKHVAMGDPVGKSADLSVPR